MTTRALTQRNFTAMGTTDPERVRFGDFFYERSAAAHVTCRVALSRDGRQFIGTAEGYASPLGDLRFGAEAAIHALEAMEPAIKLELIGVKVVRAFDANVVIAAVVLKTAASSERLLGSYLAEGDVVRGAALAILNATNRRLSLHHD